MTAPEQLTGTPPSPLPADAPTVPAQDPAPAPAAEAPGPAPRQDRAPGPRVAHVTIAPPPAERQPVSVRPMALPRARKRAPEKAPAIRAVAVTPVRLPLAPRPPAPPSAPEEPQP
ncbi:hypothetical protein [Streptomyces sp. NPDC090025]|uniref:hypothetical protein n=1 Tax=Streptomyces sp. NPDC090025 TaxID=3365922 RepID=UPI003839A984